MIYFANVNKEWVYSTKLEEVIARSFLVLHVKYAPFGLLKRNCQRVIEQNIEWLEGEKADQGYDDKERALYERTIAKLERMKPLFSATRNRKEFMRRYYNIILSLCGCGLLPRFGFFNARSGRIRGDAERESYRGVT